MGMTRVPIFGYVVIGKVSWLYAFAMSPKVGIASRRTAADGVVDAE
jgi:hypothetical protein